MYITLREGGNKVILNTDKIYFIVRDGSGSKIGLSGDRLDDLWKFKGIYVDEEPEDILKLLEGN